MARTHDKARILVAYKAEGFLGVIHTADTSHSDGSHLWALAMTAHFGPGFIHPDHLDSRGCPTDIAKMAFPRMAYQMDSAKQELEWVLGLRRRVVSEDGGTYELVLVEG